MKPKQTRITKKVIEGRLTATLVIDIVMMQNEIKDQLRETIMLIKST